MKERIFVGRGREHTVWKHGIDSPYVLKRPTLATQLTFLLQENPAQVIRNEMSWAKDFIKDTPIEIPKTRVFTIKKGYIIRQQALETDSSVSIGDIIDNTNNESLKTYWRLHPANFVSSDNTVFWVDPARGFITRSLEKLGIMNAEDYWEIKLKIKHGIRRLRHPRSNI